MIDHSELEMLCERYPLLTDGYWIHGLMSGRCMAQSKAPLAEWIGFLLGESIELSSSEVTALEQLEQQIHKALGEGGFNFIIPDGSETDVLVTKIGFFANWAEGLLFAMSLPPLSSLQNDPQVQEFIKILGELVSFSEQQKRSEILEEQSLSEMDYIELYEYVKLASCYCYEQIKQGDQTQH